MGLESRRSSYPLGRYGLGSVWRFWRGLDAKKRHPVVRGLVGSVTEPENGPDRPLQPWLDRHARAFLFAGYYLPQMLMHGLTYRPPVLHLLYKQAVFACGFPTSEFLGRCPSASGQGLTWRVCQTFSHSRGFQCVKENDCGSGSSRITHSTRRPSLSM